MLGIRLSSSVEAALERHAREIGRPKSVVARDWITERLERESIDAMMARAAAIVSGPSAADEWANTETDAWLQQLDAEDGGYDWGVDGPPA